MSERIQTNIYLLKDQVRIYEKGKITFHDVNYEFLKKFLKKRDFIEQKVKESLDTKYEIKVFHKKVRSSVKWKDFISKVVVEGETILKENKPWIESFIILFFNNDTDRILASTGGYANTTMQEIATTDFGIEILARIVKVDDKTLKSTKERNLTGGIQGSIKFFRNDHNLYENESFGKVYNELNAQLSKKMLSTSFGFKKEDLKGDSICIAKNFFSIKKALSFDELEKLVVKCENLLSRERTVEINSIDKVSRRESVLIDNLREEVLKNICSNYFDDNSFFSVEISHKDFERYFQASKSVITFDFEKKTYKIDHEGCFRNIQEIFSVLKDNARDCNNLDDFRKLINSAYLKTVDENDIELTGERLINHFCTEIKYENNTYFLMEKEWYVIKQSFIGKINEQTKYFLENKKYNGPELLKWSTGNENDYNQTYFSKNNSFVFDKFTPENIEACDLLHIEGDTIYFYHVKKGFDNSMRDLCNQVFIASKKVFEDFKSKLEYMESLYDSAKDSKGKSAYSKKVKNQFSKLSKVQFIDLVKDKKLVFVLAVLDSAKTERDLFNNIEDFESNIAKFTFIELARSMNALGAEFQIAQISKV